MQQRDPSSLIRMLTGLVAFLVTFLMASVASAETPKGEIREVEKDASGNQPTDGYAVEVGAGVSVQQLIKWHRANPNVKTGNELTWGMIHARNPNKVFPLCRLYKNDWRLGDESIWTNAARPCPLEHRTIALMAGYSGRIVIPGAKVETYAERMTRYEGLDAENTRLKSELKTLRGTTSPNVTPKPGDSAETIALKAKVSELETRNASLSTEKQTLTANNAALVTKFENSRHTGAPIGPLTYLAFGLALALTGLGTGYKAYHAGHKKALASSTAMVLAKPEKDIYTILPAATSREQTTVKRLAKTVTDSPESKRMREILKESANSENGAFTALKDRIAELERLLRVANSENERLKANPPQVHVSNSQVVMYPQSGVQPHASTVAQPPNGRTSSSMLGGFAAEILQFDSRLQIVYGGVNIQEQDPDAFNRLCNLRKTLMRMCKTPNTLTGLEAQTVDRGSDADTRATQPEIQLPKRAAVDNDSRAQMRKQHELAIEKLQKEHTEELLKKDLECARKIEDAAEDAKSGVMSSAAPVAAWKAKMSNDVLPWMLRYRAHLWSRNEKLTAEKAELADLVDKQATRIHDLERDLETKKQFFVAWTEYTDVVYQIEKAKRDRQQADIHEQTMRLVEISSDVTERARDFIGLDLEDMVRTHTRAIKHHPALSIPPNSLRTPSVPNFEEEVTRRPLTDDEPTVLVAIEDLHDIEAEKNVDTDRRFPPDRGFSGKRSMTPPYQMPAVKETNGTKRSSPPSSGTEASTFYVDCLMKTREVVKVLKDVFTSRPDYFVLDDESAPLVMYFLTGNAVSFKDMVPSWTKTDAEEFALPMGEALRIYSRPLGRSVYKKTLRPSNDLENPLPSIKDDDDLSEVPARDSSA
ncbi:MAG: hypothetical protein WC787_04245 [Patescibacteria group bacterium]|jgi:hypothetical protein